jgi:hypothetical protein
MPLYPQLDRNEDTLVPSSDQGREVDTHPAGQVVPEPQDQSSESADLPQVTMAPGYRGAHLVSVREWIDHQRMAHDGC